MIGDSSGDLPRTEFLRASGQEIELASDDEPLVRVAGRMGIPIRRV
jgi:hypothetical protein